jgi:hypothetical protein
MGALPAFIGGAMTTGFAVAALFFLRFWTRTKDPLFGAFSLACLLMAANQAISAFDGPRQSENSAAYLLRLVAFVLIVLAVLTKNGPRRR